MKLHILVVSSFLLGTTILTPISLHAEQIQDEVDSMKEETSALFGELKDKYVGLSKSYGNLETKDNNEVYNSYLNGVKSSKSDLEIEKKLEDIKNTDLSIDNKELKVEFEQAKKDAGKKLSEAKLGSDAIMKKFKTISNQQSKKQKEIENQRIKSAAKKYSAIADGYNTTLNQAGPGGGIGKPSGIGMYNASDLKYLSHSMGINFNKAVEVGKHGLIRNALTDAVDMLSSGGWK